MTGLMCLKELIFAKPTVYVSCLSAITGTFRRYIIDFS